ncbi:MAG: ATP-dependent helicase, partial [Acidobacteria bacterium]|nr:ATP-dependent helicase [Acidobacteriota bacterium]
MLDLNSEQRKAVEHGEGPLLVIAGPGSGKTRVITQRIVHLLGKGDGVGPENLLALTFTDKAAGEMKRRVSEALPGLPSSPHISTFHAFCYHILRERHFERRLLDKVDVWIFLRRRMTELGLEFYQKLAEPGAFLHALNDFFSRCQDELIEPEVFEAFVKRGVSDFAAQASALDPAEGKLREEEIQKLQELARVFRRSRQLIEDAGCSSLGSLISETVRLWDREPELLERYRARFRFVLVDEFQDTNYGQVELLRRLVAPPFNITAVGDDDQAIYRFRGASHGAFEMFDRAFSGHKTVYLERNYRSTKKILRAADGVIVRNDRYEKKKALKTDNPEGERVCLLESPDYPSESAWVAEEVERLAARGTRLAEIAVLYRAHGYRDLLVNEFRRRRIPFAIRGLSVLSSVILRDLVAYLNLVHSPHHNISLTRVLLAPRWRFPEELSLEVRRQASKARCSLWDALEAMERALFKHELENTGWGELKELLEGLKKSAPRLPMTKLLDALVDKLRLAFLPSDPDQAYVSAFRKFLGAWEEKSETRKLREFMEYFQYFLDAGGKVEAPEPEEPSNAVQMMTVHAAKGLEFSVVFIL